MQKTKDGNKEWAFKLEGKLRDRFLAIKEHTGMKSNKNVLALLISDAYCKIQASKCRRVFIPNEDYDLIEKAATAQGKTVDEYVQELTETQLRKEKEKYAES